MKRQALALTVLVTMIGCDSPTGPDSAARVTGTVTGIAISGDGTFTELNQVHLLLAMAQMQDAPVRDVTTVATWQSSDTGVVSVSARGEASAVGLGVATITASYRDHQASIVVRVVLADAAARLAGNYRLAITANRACGGLPQWATHREYDATIGRAVDGSPVLNVTLTTGRTLQFEVHVEETTLKIDFPFHFSYGSYGDKIPTFWDQIDAQRAYAARGQATATLQSITMSGTLLGEIRAVDSFAVESCSSVRDFVHQFSLSRR